MKPYMIVRQRHSKPKDYWSSRLSKWVTLDQATLYPTFASVRAVWWANILRHNMLDANGYVKGTKTRMYIDLYTG